MTWSPMFTDGGSPVADGYELDFRVRSSTPDYADYADYKTAGAVIQQSSGKWRAFGPRLRYGALHRYPQTEQYPEILGDFETREAAQAAAEGFATRPST